MLSVCLLLDMGTRVAVFAQQRLADSPPEYRSEQTYEPNSTRPRRIDSDKASDDDDPIIRVALMTDVSFVSISSSSGFTVLRTSAARRSDEKIASRPMRVEIRQQLVPIKKTEPVRERADDRGRDAASDEAKREYRVEVGTVFDTRQARKVTDELKQRFNEPATSVYDRPSDSFHILIGRFDTRGEALDMIERLRRAGYTAAHIAPELAIDEPDDKQNSKPSATTTTHNQSTPPKSHATASAKNKSTSAKPVAKSKPQPATDPAYHTVTQLVAVEADRVLATSDDRLILSAANTINAMDEARRTNDTATRRHGDAATAPRDDAATPKREASDSREPNYLEAKKRDEKKLWGYGKEAASKEAVRDDSPRPRVSASPRLDEPRPALSRAASFMRVDDKAYHGEIHLVLNARGRINVINALPMEEYLRGVVPMELSPEGFPAIEALKAQAVAARTYALAHRNASRDADFDLRDDTRSQVYGGIAAERELSTRAVDETRGIVALYTNDNGKLVPIDALYTANCGGRTENNEVIFGGKPLSYLRSVVCAPDRLTFAGRDLVSNRAADSLVESEGHSIMREIAMLQVFGLLLPRRLTNGYLRGAPEAGEMQNWIERTAELMQRDTSRTTRDDGARLTVFLQLVASAIYGEGRASLLLTPADIDYILAGIGMKDAPPDARANAAMLLKDGILRLPSTGSFDSRAQVTRAFTIETLARALTLKLKPATGNLKSQAANLKSEIAKAAENGRLIVATPAAKPQALSTAVAKAKPVERSSREMTSKEIIARTSVTKDSETRRAALRDTDLDGFEMESAAWLFRRFGDESYSVDRLTLVGGERVTYHLNTAGRVDFLEANLAERGASSDRFSSVAQWQERISAEDMLRRLERARVSVGQLESITPVAFSDSNRVIEVEITGLDGSARLRGPQIRSQLGLKENLFVVDRELDSRGRVTAFIFTGRGWGHGVGMCQVGAYGLARDGYSYTAILQKYYTGVKVQKIY